MHRWSLAGPAGRARIVRFALALVSCVAVAVIVINGVRGSLYALYGPPLPDLAVPTAAPGRDAPRAGPGNLAGWHLFGQANAPVDLAALATAPETALALRLVGTLNAENRDTGVALISATDGKQMQYRVGDELPGGARLVTIGQARVLIEIDGRREGLTLRGKPDADRPASASPVPGVVSGPDAGGFVNPALSFGAPKLSASPVAIASFEALAEQVSITPVLEGTQIAGVRIEARDPNVLTAVGLAPGDIIVAVNGEPVATLAKRRELLEELRQARFVRVTIRRGGEIRELKLGNPMTGDAR